VRPVGVARGHALVRRSAREVREDLRGDPPILLGHLWRGAHRAQVELGDAERDVALQGLEAVGGRAHCGALLDVHLVDLEALLHGPDTRAAPLGSAVPDAGPDLHPPADGVRVGVPGVISGKFSVRETATTSLWGARRDYI
jgi:hypothetical protein